jgi:hypothetical protein
MTKYAKTKWTFVIPGRSASPIIQGWKGGDLVFRGRIGVAD